MADYNVVKFSGNSNVGLSYPSYFLDFVSGYLPDAVSIVLLFSTLELKKRWQFIAPLSTIYKIGVNFDLF